MTFPTVADTSQGHDSSNATNHTVDLPPNISAGDLLIIFFGSDGSRTITFPPEYTKIMNLSCGGAATLAVAYKVAEGNEGTSIIVTTSAVEQVSYICFRITGYEGPPEISSGASSTGSQYPDPDSLAPLGGIEDYLWIASMVSDANRTVSAYPIDYDLHNLSEVGGSSGCTVATAGRQLNASSEDPESFTISTSDQWGACTIAVMGGEFVGPTPQAFNKLAYETEPPSSGWNKLAYATEPPVSAAWNKLKYPI